MEPVTTDLFIDGAARPATGKATYALVNPARPSEVVGYAAAANREDVDAAMQAAQRAFGAWAAMSMSERAAMLTHISGQLNANAAETASRARLLTREHGKTLFETNIEGPALPTDLRRSLILRAGLQKKMKSAARCSTRL